MSYANKNDSPAVSIVITNYNYGRFLQDAINSALNQTWRRTEVVVVDDGSTDDSRDIILSYGAKVYPVFKENGGMASAFNSGFSVSRGDVVISLDSDDMLFPGGVEEIVPYFEDAHVAKVHWYLSEVDENGRGLGTLTPKTSLPRGDLRDKVIRDGPIACQSSPTSGNAWSRRFLDAVMPIPELDYKRASDTYLFTLAPVFGSIERIVEPQGAYRIHGDNDLAGSSLHDRYQLLNQTYDTTCDALSRFLRSLGTEVDPATWKGQNENHVWLEQVYKTTIELADAIPEGENFIFVDNSEWEGGKVLPRRHNVPFLERNGEFWGPPPDDNTAISELERLRAAGCSFIVFAWPAFWWFDYYASFYKYLKRTYSCVLQGERTVVFDIRFKKSRSNLLRMSR